MEDLLRQLDALRLAFSLVKPSPVVEENIRRESLLKSALYSAKIEGNRLSYETVAMNLNDKTKAKLEVFNLLRAHKFIYSHKAPKKLSLKFIKRLHQMVMDQLIAGAGRFRTEAGAVFNQAGVAVYLAPPPNEIKPRLIQLIKQTQLPQAIPLKAVRAHFKFEKIHPFSDGNGRVGRLLTAAVMNQGGYGFKGLVSIEEVVNQRKQEYYRVLSETKNSLPLTKFLLGLYVKQGKKILTQLTQSSPTGEQSLPLRRREILNIIKDHPYASFNFIQRRFINVNPKTLHYDLKKLQQASLIIKIGVTRGAVYQTQAKQTFEEIFAGD